MERKVLALSIIFILITVIFVGPKTFSQSEKVLAKVGKKVITQGDLEESMKKYEALRKGKPYSLEEKKQLIDRLIQSTLVTIEAEREKLDQKPEIEAKLKAYRDELLRNEYISAKVEPLVTVTKEEVEEVWKKNPNLVPRETRTLKEIFVNTEKEAEEIYQQLKKGADFSKVATEKSISPSKARGGLIGAVSKGQLPPPLETIVFGLKEGEFSRPFKTEGGFGIFYLASKKEVPAEQAKILEEKIRAKIFQLEKNKKIEAVIEKKVGELKKQTKVEIYSDQLK